MRATWTDSRLDDFAAETGRRFDRLEQHVGAGVRELRGEIGGVRAEVGSARAEIVALRHTIIQAGVAIFGALVGVIVAILGVIATQL